MYVRFRSFSWAVVCMMATAMGVSGAAVPPEAQFAWSAPGQPATVEAVLPSGLAPATVESFVVAGEVELLGFEVRGTDPGAGVDPRSLATLQLELTGDGPVDLRAVEAALTSGDRATVELGSVRLVRADAVSGPLRFERSVAAPGIGLYLAAALRNRDGDELLLEEVSFLPPGLAPGSIWFAVDAEPQALLLAIEEALPVAPGVPAAARPLASMLGLTRLGAEPAAPAVPPGHAIVLVWFADAFAFDPPHSLRLAPVVVYRMAGSSDSYTYGLPVAIRSAP